MSCLIRMIKGHRMDGRNKFWKKGNEPTTLLQALENLDAEVSYVENRASQHDEKTGHYLLKKEKEVETL